MCIYDFTHCVDLGCSSRMLFFLSVFFVLFSTFIHSTLSVLCLPPLSAHLWSDKSQIIWLTMQNSARCRNPPIPSSTQLANYSEELALASLPRWGGEERDRDWWGKEEARDGERKRKKEKEQKERGRQRWWASAGRGGINFLDRQEQLWFTACRGTDRWSHTSSLLLLLQTSLCSDEPATTHERTFRLGAKLRYWTISNNMIRMECITSICHFHL